MLAVKWIFLTPLCIVSRISSPQRAGASCLSRPIYLPRCTFVVFNYCCCVEFWWRLFVSLHRIFPDIWFPIYCILLAKRNVQQKIPSTCQETTVEEWSANAQRFERGVAELEMIALSNYDMKIGFLKTNSGRVYFQVFHPAAFFIMDKADQYQYLGNCPPTPPLTQH